MKTLLLALSIAFTATSGHAVQLSPHKDKLFSYPQVIEQSADGSYRLIDYQRPRDLVQRDAVPKRKARREYVDEGVRWSRRVRSYKSPNGTFKMFATGKYRSGATVTVIYVHGKGGNRRQGVNDWTFGGNFNRLQNLMVAANGVLLTPDFSNFRQKGTVDIAHLIAAAKARSPRGKLIVACGSMGGGICWRLAKAPATLAMMDGMLLLGSHWHDDFLKSPAVNGAAKPLPIVFGHGNADVTYKPNIQRKFFEKIRAARSGYPAKFVMFNTGVHGTPIRMIDWRQELNWILAQRP